MATMISTELGFFEGKQIRKVRDSIREQWLFSVVDVVSALSSSVDGRKYRNKLKERLKAEGSEVVTKCHQLKLMAKNKYITF